VGEIIKYAGFVSLFLGLLLTALNIIDKWRALKKNSPAEANRERFKEIETKLDKDFHLLQKHILDLEQIHALERLILRSIKGILEYLAKLDSDSGSAKILQDIAKQIDDFLLRNIYEDVRRE
jgi:arginine decarboxylase-like protein